MGVVMQLKDILDTCIYALIFYAFKTLWISNEYKFYRIIYYQYYMT